MTCQTCTFKLDESCKFYYNDYTTHLICIFKRLPIELVRYMIEYIYNFKGHKVNDKLLCTSCFQLGYYKLIHSNKIISRYNIMNFFDSWIDDFYTNEVQTFFRNKIIPLKIEL
jgi:hypothetical protein